MRGYPTWVVSLTLALSGCTPVLSGDGGLTDSSAPTDATATACARIGTGSDAGTLDIGPIVHAATRPPALSGGTLIVSHDTHYAVASDPDRDRVTVVDLANERVAAQIALSPGDEPGRLVEDAAGRVHVVLRSGAAIATIDLATLALLSRDAVCAAPRGIAYESATDRVHVACAGGEVVSLAAAGGAPVRTVRLDSDLRDIVVDGSHLIVTQFRSARALVTDATGAMTSRTTLPSMTRTLTSSTARDTAIFDGDLAWRTVARPGGGALILHERAESSAVTTPPATASYYNTSPFDDTCPPGPVHHSVSAVNSDGLVRVGVALDAALSLPIDLAISNDGTTGIVIGAGSVDSRSEKGILFRIADLWNAPCIPANSSLGMTIGTFEGRATAVAFVGASTTRFVVQTREPAAIVVFDAHGGNAVPLASIQIATDSREDTGHYLFHTSLANGVTCADCHAEGGDDGHVWNFPCDGPRRSQSLRGGLLATAPFHWDGHLATFDDLAVEVFSERLGTARPTPEQSQALAAWIDSLPSTPRTAPSDPSAVERGRQLFTSATVGCASCHSGDHLTNNTTVDVGTGGAFQVPSLIGVALHPPFMHDGCAPTLRDRFGACGGGDRHGHTSQLSEAQLADLIAYMGSL